MRGSPAPFFFGGRADQSRSPALRRRLGPQARHLRGRVSFVFLGAIAMKLLVLALAFIAAAVVAAPGPARHESSTQVWSEPVVRAASLGRPHAAADIVWMKTVQLIGDAREERRGYPSLDEWVDLASRLDPRFDLPYFFGVVLLVTDDERAPRVDEILARGEAALPDVFSLPMFRGFLAYFGRLDPRAAAAHFRRAAALPGSPAYLVRFAARLEREEDTCSALLRDLREVSRATGGTQGKALDDSREKVLIHCLETRIERAANAWRVRNAQRVPTLEDLVKDGAIDPQLPAPPGLCWSLDPSQNASLAPCPSPPQPPAPATSP